MLQGEMKHRIFPVLIKFLHIILEKQYKRVKVAVSCGYSGRINSRFRVHTTAELFHFNSLQFLSPSRNSPLL
jgi:hypothetical protein